MSRGPGPLTIRQKAWLSTLQEQYGFDDDLLRELQTEFTLFRDGDHILGILEEKGFNV